MNLNLGNKTLMIILMAWFFILAYQTGNVVNAEYYTDHRYLYDDGGQIVNTTMLEGEYVYIYTDGEGYGTGKTPHKIIIGDTFIRYNVCDGLDIPVFYTPRCWQELRINDEIVETTEGHLPINILIGLYVTQFVILGIGIINYAKKGIKSKTDQ